MDDEEEEDDERLTEDDSSIFLNKNKNKMCSPNTSKLKYFSPKSISPSSTVSSFVSYRILNKLYDILHSDSSYPSLNLIQSSDNTKEFLAQASFYYNLKNE